MNLFCSFRNFSLSAEIRRGCSCENSEIRHSLRVRTLRYCRMRNGGNFYIRKTGENSKVWTIPGSYVGYRKIDLVGRENLASRWCSWFATELRSKLRGFLLEKWPIQVCSFIQNYIFNSNLNKYIWITDILEIREVYMLWRRISNEHIWSEINWKRKVIVTDVRDISGESAKK